MSIKCILVGLGNIGFKYDSNLEDKTVHLTHARTIGSLENFELICGIDKDTDLCAEFKNRFSVDAFTKISDMPSYSQIDLIVIATPTINHLETFREVVKLNPRVILLEKPAASSSIEIQIMKEIALENGIKIFVNFQRNYHSVFQDLSKRLEDSTLPGPFTLIGWFNKGLLHTGSHMLALWQLLFPKAFMEIKLENLVEGDFQIHKSSPCMTLVPVDHFEGSFFSFDMLGSKHHVRYDSHLGVVKISTISQSKLYSGEQILQAPSSEILLKEESCLWQVYFEIQKFLIGEPCYHSSLDDSIQMLEIIKAIEGS
jgi:hypothetical protein